MVLTTLSSVFITNTVVLGFQLPCIVKRKLCVYVMSHASCKQMITTSRC